MDKIYLIEISVDRDMRITWSPTIEGIPAAVRKAVDRSDWDTPVYATRAHQNLSRDQYGWARWIADYGNFKEYAMQDGEQVSLFTQEPYHVSAALVEPGQHIQVDS